MFRDFDQDNFPEQVYRLLEEGHGISEFLSDYQNLARSSISLAQFRDKYLDLLNRENEEKQENYEGVEGNEEQYTLLSTLQKQKPVQEEFFSNDDDEFYTPKEQSHRGPVVQQNDRYFQPVSTEVQLSKQETYQSPEKAHDHAAERRLEEQRLAYEKALEDNRRVLEQKIKSLEAQLADQLVAYQEREKQIQSQLQGQDQKQQEIIRLMGLVEKEKQAGQSLKRENQELGFQLSSEKQAQLALQQQLEEEELKYSQLIKKQIDLNSQLNERTALVAELEEKLAELEDDRQRARQSYDKLLQTYEEQQAYVSELHDKLRGFEQLQDNYHLQGERLRQLQDKV